MARRRALLAYPPNQSGISHRTGKGLSLASGMVCHFPSKSTGGSAHDWRSSSINLPLPMDGDRLAERAISTCRQVLNKTDFSALRDAGAQLTIEEILALVELSG